jgi:hypothetical protein
MRWLWSFVGIVLLLTAVRARGDEEAPPEAGPAPTPSQIQQWVRDLDSERYQAREDATAGLLRSGYDAVAPVAQAAAQGSLEVAIRAIFVLREAALAEDAKTSEAAEQALRNLAQTPSLAAPRATSTLAALAELRQRRIRGYLAAKGAKFQSTQRFAGVDPFPDPFGLWLDQDWKGTEEDLAKLKFLTQITSVALDGPRVNDSWLRFVAEMPSVASVSIKRANITHAGLSDLKRIPNLQELNVYYSPIGDAAVEHLTSLRGLTVLKLYGGQFSLEGEQRLKAAFAQAATLLDIRKGAFLGVSCQAHPAGCMISYVREGSAAAKAGLQPGDIVVRYDGKKVEDFDGLTALIAQHAPGEASEMEVLRGPNVIKRKVTLGEWE